ncbi:MAG: hypothetical protein HOQ11_05350 [Gemmatimonadaceae bacterium]|nr:hypothetical protein [Gemmatimonadaceae bacterium]NUQ93842.1 hypothetical protein [Gemmatimonadaceae bacterium]NUR19050.1 hypothetical protein [Gemmatimonadaceae bacterium]NUS96815.1 hypothetical protein [Gemmatimonadaceae bacterium]
MKRYTMLAIALVLGACKSEVVFVPPPPCGGPIEVMVSGTTTPEFSWIPACGITNLTVRHESATLEPDPWMWSFSVPESAPVGPALAYGKAPGHATVYLAPKSLIAGEVYRVTVTYVVGGDVVSATGTKTFTWYPPD